MFGESKPEGFCVATSLALSILANIAQLPPWAILIFILILRDAIETAVTIPCIRYGLHYLYRSALSHCPI